MRFFTTMGQRKVLQRYWTENKPFSVDTLLREKVLRNRLLGNITLWSMERKGQIIHPLVGDPRYIGTTDSSDEWNRLYENSTYSEVACGFFNLNRYECEKVISGLCEVIEEYSQSDEE